MSTANDTDLLEFPCCYEFKAIGAGTEEFRYQVVRAVSLHARCSADAVRCRPSRNGAYQSVSLLVTLHSYRQLTDIYAELKTVADLKMLL